MNSVHVTIWLLNFYLFFPFKDFSCIFKGYFKCHAVIFRMPFWLWILQLWILIRLKIWLSSVLQKKKWRPWRYLLFSLSHGFTFFFLEFERKSSRVIWLMLLMSDFVFLFGNIVPACLVLIQENVSIYDTTLHIFKKGKFCAWSYDSCFLFLK